jgi:purine-binding chemotaxis protein CheW
MDRKDSAFVKSELTRRAAVLAQPPVKEDDIQDRIEVMTFLLASERYALETRYIREVWPLTSYIPVPHTPPFVTGVTNVHGAICSIVDLKQFFSLPSNSLTNLNKLVILECGEMCFGILADDVLGTESISKRELSSTDEWQGIDSTYLTGITCDRLIVLDAERILTDKRLIVNETVEI